jgi:polyisoprenyl-teichoic acid--peptidoglycan teichoic acid transferase
MASRLERQVEKRRIEKYVIFGIAILLMLGVGFLWGNSLGRSGPLGILGPAPGRVNILVLGVDERSDDSGRSDTMFVIAVDPNAQDVDIISIPRDTRVKIPGFGYDKINHAYAQGKYKLAQRTVENLLGVSMQYYLIIDFNGFKRIIDALGGVTIDVEKRMYYEDPYDNLVIDLRPGVQKLNGDDAIGYVRYRDQGGDLGRIQRQQKFMKAVMQQVTQPSTIGQLPTLVKELSGAVRTNMSSGDLVNLAKLINDARKHGLKGHVIPGTPIYIGEISYVLPDIVEMRRMIAEIMGITPDAKALAATQQLASEYERSVPQETKTAPILPTADAKPDDKNKTADAAKPDKNLATKPGTTPGTKTDGPKPGGTKSPKLRAEIINASGDDEAGAKMASELRQHGFEVVAVITPTNLAKMTIIVDHTGSETVVNKISSLPFDYNLSILKDGVKSAEITVIIGKNYK